MYISFEILAGSVSTVWQGKLHADSQEDEGGTKNLVVFSMIFLIGEFMMSMCVFVFFATVSNCKTYCVTSSFYTQS